MKRSLTLSFALFTLLLSLAPARLLAQAPQRTDAFVYALTAWDGQAYHSAFAPPNVEEIFLLEGAPSVISPRQTRTYFWPLSNRYEADWLARNEFVDGTLEVLQGNTLVGSFAPVDYVIQIDDSTGDEQGKLFTGDEASAAWADFRARQAAYRDALYDYSVAYQQYRDEMDRLFAGKGSEPIAPEALPERPTPVPPLSLSSSELARGYVLDLAPGSYTVQMRLADGSLLPGSQRALTVFAPISEGVSYTTMPQERWTQPEIARVADAAIYTPQGGALFLQPFRQVQYNDYTWTHLQEPQTDAGRRDQLRWVSYRPIENGVLAVGTGDNAAQIEGRGYKVTQLAGSGLGYEVREVDPAGGETPSFVGFAVTPPDTGALQIALQDETGAPFAGSARSIRALRTDRMWVVYGAVLLAPLLGGIVLYLRSRRARHVRILDENMGAWSQNGVSNSL